MRLMPVTQNCIWLPQLLGSIGVKAVSKAFEDPQQKSNQRGLVLCDPS